jgi:hypothetical protein
MPGDDDDYLWEIDFNATKTTLSQTPVPNPLPIPSNVTVGTVAATSVGLMWNDLPTANSYKVQQSADGGDTWTDVTSQRGGAPTVAATSVTSLTASTAYQFRVAGVFGSDTGSYSSPVSVTTPSS